jgi:hypothetical protein
MNYRHLWITSVGVFCALVGSTAWAQLDAIPDQYEIRSILDADFGIQLKQCTPEVNQSTIDAIIDTARTTDLTASRSGSLGRPGWRTMVIYANGMWACIRMSLKGYALLPPAALRSTVSPTGATPQALHQWRKGLLADLAQTGLARGIIVNNDSTAQLVYYTLSKDSVRQVDYEDRLLKSDEYKIEDFRHVLREPGIKSTSVTSYGSPATKSKFFANTNDLRRAAIDGYVVIEPGSSLSASDIGGSRWKQETTASSATVLQFDKEGIVIMTSPTGINTPGTWQVLNNVLRVRLNTGVHYSLALDGNRRFLDGQLRRTNIPTSIPGRPVMQAHDDQDNEWRNRAPRMYRETDTEYEATVAIKRQEAVARREAEMRKVMQEIEHKRFEILSESQDYEQAEQSKASARSPNARGTVWSLCDTAQQMTLLSATLISSEPSQGRVGTQCRSWYGSRKEWKETILKDGCNGRCQPF